MRKLGLFKYVALGCAALLLTSYQAGATQVLRANAGTTFTLESTADPSVFTHKVDGIAQVYPIGNCKVHFDVVVRFPADPTQPLALAGSLVITSANGNDTLNATVVGAATADPNNPQEFINFHYRVAFTGGTGQFQDARGSGLIRGAALFTSPLTGKATWMLGGYVTP